MRILITAALIAAGLWFPIAAQQREMTYAEYRGELQSALQRERTARQEITALQAQIDSLRSQVAQVERRIAAVIQEQYAILGITEQDVASAQAVLADLGNALNQYLLLSPDELRRRSPEIGDLEARLAALKAKKVCLLYGVAEKVSEVESALWAVKAQLRQATAPPATSPVPSTRYTVLRSGTARNLSKIAESVYGDQYEWPRIYRANKNFIDKWYIIYKNRTDELEIMRPQDFLLPGWTLEIPR